MQAGKARPADLIHSSIRDGIELPRSRRAQAPNSARYLQRCSCATMATTVAKMESSLKGVIFRRGEWLVAQILEHDIATQARGIDDLLADIQRILQAHLVIAREHGKEPFQSIPAAPSRYWHLFETGAPLYASAASDQAPALTLHSALLDLSRSGTAAAAATS